MEQTLVGVTYSVLRYVKKTKFAHNPPSAEATAVMKNWVSYLPDFTRYAKTNKYYPQEFKERAFVFILCCLRSKVLYKDMIYLLLEYIAKACFSKKF